MNNGESAAGKYGETELIPAISNVRMYKETVSFWFMVGQYLHFPESGFFLFDEMKEGGALSSSYDDFWHTLASEAHFTRCPLHAAALS
ncbi:hypothetical protein J41TS12_48060 [Paenibacillus antibioticophila]|uniref:Uncharacterized protein n=1 Tax=Paenibacillus antibioticophila TaxID=1274374 RepID=A0A919XZZ4_9BACL|nr:hypothetical protein J41TS12_48060 [Paenibacillus antibioticophila]